MMSATETLAIDPAARRRSLFDSLQSARRSIHLSLFRCNDSTIVSELIRAHRRGVDVRLLMTNRAKRSMTQLDELCLAFRREGLRAIRYAGPHERYHAKYAVFDGTSAIVSSMNLTREPFVETDDVLLRTQDRGIVAGLRELFHADQMGCKHFRTATRRLVISPDSAREQLTALIDDAKASLLIVDDSLAVAGSLALSQSTLEERRDLAVIIESPTLVRQLVLHLREMKELRCA